MSKHRTKVQIRFVDIDAMGHVNNAVHLNFFEEARIAFFRDTIGEDWDWQHHGILLARNEVDYHHPLRLQDDLEVETDCTRLGTKSLDLTYRILKMEEGKEMVCAVGVSTLVCFDYGKQETIEVPEVWRERMG